MYLMTHLFQMSHEVRLRRKHAAFKGQMTSFSMFLSWVPESIDVTQLCQICVKRASSYIFPAFFFFLTNRGM